MKSAGFPMMTLLATIALTAAACDGKSTVEFKGDRLLDTRPDLTSAALAPTGGGHSARTTASQYRTDLTLSAGSTEVQGETAGHYRVRLNLQGQQSSVSR